MGITTTEMKILIYIKPTIDLMNLVPLKQLLNQYTGNNEVELVNTDFKKIDKNKNFTQRMLLDEKVVTSIILFKELEKIEGVMAVRLDNNGLNMPYDL